MVGWNARRRLADLPDNRLCGSAFVFPSPDRNPVTGLLARMYSVFRLAARPHRPFRGVSVAGGRAGERKTCWANPLAPQLRATSRCCVANWGLDPEDLSCEARACGSVEWSSERRGRYSQCGYGTDFEYMGFVCLRMEGRSIACTQRCKQAATCS